MSRPLDFIEVECTIYQNVQYFIRSKLRCELQHSLCTSVVKQHVTCLCSYQNSRKPYTSHWVVRT